MRCQKSSALQQKLQAVGWVHGSVLTSHFSLGSTGEACIFKSQAYVLSPGVEELTESWL